MTTMPEARDELIAALTTAGVRASADPTSDTPFVFVTGDGTGDLGRVVAGQVAAQFRLVMCGGAWDQAAAATELDNLKQAVLVALRSLAGWALTGPVGPDTARDQGGGLILTADAFAARLIDI